MKEAKEFLNNLLIIDDIVVVACSGGPDSMCLLHVVNSLKKEKNLKIICAHVNHGLRKESNQEAKFVENYCVTNNIIFEYMKIDSYKNNKFSEEEGRRKRYNFFNKVIKKYNAKYLMTAHHGDDLIETIMMRIVRGSNLKGYVGISKLLTNENYSVVRPLLSLNKEEIYEYLKEHRLDYVTDNSNQEEKYTRNRYRKHLLPFLKNEDERVHLKFVKYSNEVEKAHSYITKLVKEKIKKIYVGNYIVINNLLEEDEYLQEKIVEYIIEDIQKRDIFNINDKQFNNLMELLKNKSNKAIDLADNYVARKSYNKLYIEKRKNCESYEYELTKNMLILDKYNFEFLEDSASKSNYIIRLNSSELELPLIVRQKTNGDKIKVKNLKGTKKVKDIFIDCKMDLQKRNEYPIITDSKNVVIWVPGIKKSIFDKEIDEKCDIIIKYTEERNEQSK